METITFKDQAAQGDLYIRRIDRLPTSAIKQSPEADNKYIVAHSETGHHHVVESFGVDYFLASNDPWTAYLVVDNTTELKHLRSFDTHKTITIGKGAYELRRQREYTPEGWRTVVD